MFVPNRPGGSATELVGKFPMLLFLYNTAVDHTHVLLYNKDWLNVILPTSSLKESIIIINRFSPGDEMVYIVDLKSTVCDGRTGSSPVPGTRIVKQVQTC